jgi:predicted DCC family thiol-disulfide oxidoreductase YuxK
MPEALKPVLVYDGDCSFCRLWIDYWRQLTGDAIEYAPFQEAADRYPNIPRESFAKSVQLIFPSGEVRSGAHAVFETLAVDPSRRWLLSLYQHLPGFAALTEAGYRFVAGHRSFLYRVTQLLFGRTIDPLRFDLVQWLFIRALGLIWLIAFASFAVQSSGLIGSQGIQPLTFYLARLSGVLHAEAYRLAPTVFWLDSGDTVLHAVCLVGMLCGLLIFLGTFWRAALLTAFILYLSLVNVSQEFLSYQWDILLLETSFLAIFLGYSRVINWLFRWLLFRLMFLSGAVKLLSGDPSWHSLTALTFHYQTQPIPTPFAWYAHQMPLWFQKVSCASVLFVELVIPFLAFAPRRARMFALPWLISLQVLILLTGNYAFFNLLALALCLFLLDDAALPRFLAKFQPGASQETQKGRRSIARAVAVFVFILSGLLVVQTLSGSLPRMGRTLISIAAPFGITSTYGLFATMTTARPEIIVEGSLDGVTWLEYEFKYKPGRLNRPPPWVAPHQPRLDWQMWFAALGSYTDNVWFLNFLARLLQDDAAVLALMERDPFDGPPQLVRARLYDYRFTDWNTRRQTGNWWTRKPLGLYVPPVSLENLSGLPLLAPNTR